MKKNWTGEADEGNTERWAYVCGFPFESVGTTTSGALPVVSQIRL